MSGAVAQRRWAAILVVALVAGIALFLTDSSLRARALDYAQRDLRARAQTTADAMDRALRARLIQTLTLAALPSLRGFAASDEQSRAQRAALAQNELHAIVAADPNARAASILDAGGVVALTTDNSIHALWSERAFFRAALRGELHASPPARDFGEVSHYYSAPLIDNAGRVRGVLVVRVAAQELWDGLPKNILVVDENGVVMADTSDKPQNFIALAPIDSETHNRLIAERRYGAELGTLRFSNQTALLALIQQDNAGAFTFRDAGGRAQVGAARKLQINPWRVLVSQSEEETYAFARDALGHALALGTFAFFVGIGLMFAWRRS